MSESEAIEKIKRDICNGNPNCICRDACMYGKGKCAYDMATDAIEEIQQYRAIGTVKGYERAIQISQENYNLYREYKAKLQEYEDIGTVEEFRELKGKATAKKIGHCVFYREMGYGTPWQCLSCGADQTKVEFSCEDGSEPEEKHTFCWHCGQKLDWSE